jgi:uncharacterized membrane protein SpoIIM required for sporulation
VTVERFRREREGEWTRLDAALRDARGRPERLGPAGVLALGGLYRSAAADLALARRLFPYDPTTATLEALVVRARAVVYADAGPGRSVWAFLATGFWRTLRERPAALVASATLLLGFAALGILWGATDPGSAAGFVPSQFIDGADPPQGSAGLTTAQSAAFSSELFTNNLQVCFLVFAAGLLWCVGGALVLAYNGALLGTVLGIALSSGHLDDVLVLVTAHGAIELTGIVVSGAAGLRLGWALVAPGTRTRPEALAEAARPAVAMVLGVAPWIVLAGLLEAFISPRGFDAAVVVPIGLSAAGAFWALVAWRGRRPTGAGAPSP